MTEWLLVFGDFTELWNLPQRLFLVGGCCGHIAHLDLSISYNVSRYHLWFSLADISWNILTLGLRVRYNINYEGGWDVAGKTQLAQSQKYYQVGHSLA
jgi:hypothetical protein